MPNGEFDVFGENWGVGNPAAWFDWTAIEALIAATPHIAIDQLFLGWEGKEEKALGVIQQVLLEHGFFFGTNAEGLWTFAQLRMADIRDASGATAVQPLPYELEQNPSEGEGVDQMRGTIGATPWSQGRPYSVSVLGQVQAGEPSTALRAAVFNADRASGIDMNTRSITSSAQDLASIAANRAYGVPRVMVKIHDTGFAHGEFVRLLDPGHRVPYFRDLEGNPVTATDVAKFYGMIVSKTPNHAEGTLLVELLLTNWLAEDFARLRAPSAQCSGANTGAVYPIGDTFSSYTFAGDDAAEFEVGQPVELWRPDGVRRSGTSGTHDIETIKTISAGSIELNTAFTTAAQAGDIIRLAPLNDSISGTAEDGSDLPYTSYIAYVFMAASDEKLGPNDLDGHIYAVGQI